MIHFHATRMSCAQRENHSKSLVIMVLLFFLGVRPALAQSLIYIGVTPVTDPTGILVSENRASVYVLRAGADAIDTLPRDSVTGVWGAPRTIDRESSGISNLRSPWKMALSPDQSKLYVVCRGSLTDATNPDALLVFDRDISSGALVYRESHINGVAGVSGIGLPSSVTVSPDGTHVYVTSQSENAVALFVQSNNGGLQFVESYKQGSAGINALDQPLSAQVSPDGKHLYVGAQNSKSIARFSRDSISGKLTWLGALVDNSSASFALAKPLAISESQDGRFVYVASESDGAVSVFVRDTMTGDLTPRQRIKQGDTGVDHLDHVTSIVLSADETRLFAVSPTANTLSVFTRNPTTGELIPLEALVDAGNGGDSLGGAVAVTRSADGRWVDVAATSDDAISSFSVGATNLHLAVDSPAGARLANKTLTLSLTVQNAASSGTATGVRLFANVPDELNVTDVQPESGSCSKRPAMIDCMLNTLGSGTSTTVTIIALPTQSLASVLRFSVVADQHDEMISDNNVEMILEIVDTNHTPQAVDDSVVTTVNQSLEIDVLANDSDPDPNDALTIKSFNSTSVQGGSVVRNAAGTLTYTPPSGFKGPDSFNYTVNDVEGATASAQVNIFVNSPPIAVDDVFTVLPGAPATLLVLLNDHDPDINDPVWVADVDVVSSGGNSVTVSPNGDAVKYFAARDFLGTDDFTYTLTDSHGALVTAHVTVKVVASLAAAQDDGTQATATKKKKHSGAFDPLWLIALMALTWKRRRCFASRQGGRRHLAVILPS